SGAVSNGPDHKLAISASLESQVSRTSQVARQLHVATRSQLVRQSQSPAGHFAFASAIVTGCRGDGSADTTAHSPLKSFSRTVPLTACWTTSTYASRARRSGVNHD